MRTQIKDQATGAARRARLQGKATVAGRAQLKDKAAGVARRARPASAKLAAAAKQRANPMAAQARTWTANRLDKSSAAVQETLAPRLSSALAATARRVRPASPRRKMLRKIMRGAGLIGAIGLAAATAFAVRNRSASSTPYEPSASNGQPAGEFTAAKDAQSSVAVLNPSAEAGAEGGR